MDTNLAALMIVGEGRLQLKATQRQREQLLALLESRKVQRVGLIDRLLGHDRPKIDAIDLVCCPA